MATWILKLRPKNRRTNLHFYDFRFFLGREIPRESLVFMIRAFGGEASWDETCAPGATFKEDDSQITHQVSWARMEGVVGALIRSYFYPRDLRSRI